MNIIIFLTSLFVLGLLVIVLVMICLNNPSEKIQRWVFGSTQVLFECPHCGSEVETKFTNRTDRILEYIFCSVCGEPKEL